MPRRKPAVILFLAISILYASLYPLATKTLADSGFKWRRLNIPAEGRLKAPEKISASAAQILSRNHGHRYYDWEINVMTNRPKTTHFKAVLKPNCQTWARIAIF